MLKKIMWVYNKLKTARPGKRFTKVNQENKKQNEPNSQRVYMVLGVFLVIFGILLSIPPGIPGFIVSAIGLAFIALRSRKFASKLDSLELLFHKWKSFIIGKK